MSSNPPSPFEETPSPVPPKRVSAALERVIASVGGSGPPKDSLPGKWQFRARSARLAGGRRRVVVFVLYVRIRRRTSEFVDGS